MAGIGQQPGRQRRIARIALSQQRRHRPMARQRPQPALQLCPAAGGMWRAIALPHRARERQRQRGVLQMPLLGQQQDGVLHAQPA